MRHSTPPCETSSRSKLARRARSRSGDGYPLSLARGAPKLSHRCPAFDPCAAPGRKKAADPARRPHYFDAGSSFFDRTSARPA